MVFSLWRSSQPVSWDVIRRWQWPGMICDAFASASFMHADRPREVAAPRSLEIGLKKSCVFRKPQGPFPEESAVALICFARKTSTETCFFVRSLLLTKQISQIKLQSNVQLWLWSCYFLCRDMLYWFTISSLIIGRSLFNSNMHYTSHFPHTLFQFSAKWVTLY